MCATCVLWFSLAECQQETQVGTLQARSSPRQAALHRVRVSQIYLLRWSGQNRSSTSFIQLLQTLHACVGRGS